MGELVEKFIYLEFPFIFLFILIKANMKLIAKNELKVWPNAC